MKKRNFKLLILGILLNFFLGCVTNYPGIIGESPLTSGTYLGTLTGKAVLTDFQTGSKQEIPLNIPSTEIINQIGIPCNMNGQQVIPGMVLNSQMGNSSAEDVIQGVIASEDGVTINTTWSIQIEIDSSGTVKGTGRRSLTYLYQDNHSIRVKVHFNSVDKTGRYSLTGESSGLLSRSN